MSVLTGFPGVVLLLLSGLLIGRSGLGLVEPLDLGQGLEIIVGLLVSLVLFDGGLNLRLPGETIKSTVFRILVIRLFISLGAVWLIAHLLAGLAWNLAAVYSAIVLATGPTVVTPLIQQIRLAPPLGDVLEAEGLVLEPVGAVLALLLLELLVGDLHGWKELLFGLLSRLGGGVLMGLLFGWVLAEGLKRLKTDYIDLYQLHWPERHVNSFGRLGYEHKENNDWTKFEDVLGNLQRFIDAGKIRKIGLSNETPWGVSKYLELSKEKSLPRMMSIQNPYSLVPVSYTHLTLPTKA